MLIGMVLTIGTVQGQVTLTVCNPGNGSAYLLPEIESVFDSTSNGITYVALDENNTTIFLWGPDVTPFNDSLYSSEVGTLPWFIIATFGDTIGTIDNIHIVARPQICLATTDSTSTNVEIKLTHFANAGYGLVDLYRYVTSTTSVLVGTIDTSSLTITDTDVNVQSTSYSYYVEVEGCPISDAHNTIYLSQGPGSTGVNLAWTEYTIGGSSDEIDGYTVWKYDNATSEFAELTSVIGLGYTDLNGTSDDVYFIEATKIGGCADNPYAKLDGSQGSIVSNLFGVNFTGIDDVQSIDYSMVNPSDGIHLTIDRPMDVSIYDLNGRLINTHSQITKLDDPLENGIYLVTLNDGRNAVTKRLVVVK